MTFYFPFWRGTRGRRVAKVPSTDKIISRNKKFGRGSEEPQARVPGRASAHVNNQGDIEETAPGQGDCGPDCQNLLHELGHPKEATRCPQGQVIDIWGYCRFVIIIIVSRCHVSPLITQSVNCCWFYPRHFTSCCPSWWPGQVTFRASLHTRTLHWPDFKTNVIIIMISPRSKCHQNNRAVQCHYQSQRLMEQELGLHWSDYKSW